jgi:hypothetical protein
VAPRKIVSVGIDVASDLVDRLEFKSSSTLLDWDVVVFTPNISSMMSYSDSYQGKASLNEGMSFRLKERCEHWRREINQMLKAGRTVICYLPELQELFVDTGQRNYSGTGRNRHTTMIVAPYSNYECLPFNLKPRNSSGSAMKLSQRASPLAQYWAAFGEQSEFKVTIHGSVFSSPILTKVGDIAVGGIQSTPAGGNFVALPMLNFYRKDLYGTDGNFNKAAKRFAGQLVQSWFELDAAVRSQSEITPPPPWSEDASYSLVEESGLRATLLEVEQRLIEARKRKEEVVDALAKAGSLRALLYEKGTPLENAIIKALLTLGFQASPYKDSHSEFDVVFTSDEGRLLGEAEGKDNKAINIDKLRQLAMNIHEDLQREEVTSPAKPVLFGNGYRLKPPGDRSLQFTEKCVASAQSAGTALVATTELFSVSKYVADSGDEEFAAQCRAALLSGTGIVLFPQPPSVPEPMTAEE